MVSLSEPKRRSEILRVRCTPEDLERWQAIARSRDETVSGIVRCLLDGTPEKVRAPIPPVDARLIRQVAMVGSNLNQIARVVNEARVIEVHADARDILGHLVIVERTLRQLVQEASG
jgi:hypothetical protein